jgi:phosphoribosylformylglycinamidine synthase
MVFAVPQESVDEMVALCQSEGVEAAVIGRFAPTGRLQLTYHGETVGDLSMKFMHDGRPPIIRDAVYCPPETVPVNLPDMSADDHADALVAIMGSLNVASKHWVIRQYDHEVQGGSVVKPLVGPQCDGPGDAAVIRPLMGSRRGLVISCGMNPHFGDFDTYHMAASAIDEAMRNAVAVGADPSKIAVLDNFCWGYTDRPETLGSLVRSAIACQDLAVALGTPFISGKDSLNNEFSYFSDDGTKNTIAIPSTLLISAMGQIDDVSKSVTMDAKEAGNVVFQIGQTKAELGGSHLCLVNDLSGGQVPTVDAINAKSTFAAVHGAISAGWVRSCHDLSEGGLAAAAVEMAMAGGLGMKLAIDGVAGSLSASETLFSESNTRFLIETTPENAAAVEKHFGDSGVSVARLGTIGSTDQLVVTHSEETILDVSVSKVKEAWLKPLDW